MKTLMARRNSRLRNQRGNAMVETLPILVVFIVLFSFGLGFFGVVHTGIMNSMAARAYAFETFQNRSDVGFFRDRATPEVFQHYGMGNRFHTVDTENKVDQGLRGPIHATARDIAFGRKIASTDANVMDHNVNIYTIAGRNRKGGVEASPAWIMVGYGICIDAGCGD